MSEEIRAWTMKLNGRTLIAPVLLVSLALVGCGSKSSGLATVNGTAISQAELLQYLQSKETVRVNIQGQVIDAPVADTLAFQAMQDLVVRKLVMDMAKEAGVSPTKEDVDNEIKLRESVNKNYIQAQQMRGKTLEGIRDNVQIELAQQRILAKGVTVTDSDVDAYIGANPNEFTEPATVEAYIIVVSAANKGKVDAELAKGKKFSDVAAAYSEDANARATGGKLGGANSTGVPLNSLPQQLQEVVNRTTANTDTEWIAADAGKVIKMKVVRKTAARKMEMTKERKEMVKRSLAVQRGSEGKDMKTEITKRLAAAKIEVTDETLKALWKNFSDMLKQSTSGAALPK